MDNVDTGVTLIPHTHRSSQSIATVSSAWTHFIVIGSMAKTSRRVVSISRYSPGLVGLSFPYAPGGRVAMSRLRFVLSRKVGSRRSSSSSHRYAVARPGSFTSPSP